MIPLKKFVVGVPALLIAAAVLVQPSEALAKQRIEVKYKKFAQDPNGLVWVGLGSVDGVPVRVKALWPLAGRRVTGKVIHVTQFRFGVYAFGDVALANPLVVIDLVGTINTKNGKIVMNGAVSGSAVPAVVPAGSRSQLRAQAAPDFSFTEGSVFLTVP